VAAPALRRACAEGPRGGEKAVALDIGEWGEAWLPKLKDDGMRVAVFQTLDDDSVGVAPERLRRDLDDELSQFEL
jgi:predicted aconitase